MLIRLQSPSIADFDPIPSVDRWMISPTGQRRRTMYKKRTRHSSKHIAGEVVDLTLTESVATEETVLQEEDSEENVHNEHDEPETVNRESERDREDECEIEEESESESESESECEQDEKENESLLNEVLYEWEMEYE